LLTSEVLPQHSRLSEVGSFPSKASANVRASWRVRSPWAAAANTLRSLFEHKMSCKVSKGSMKPCISRQNYHCNYYLAEGRFFLPYKSEKLLAAMEGMTKACSAQPMMTAWKVLLKETSIGDGFYFVVRRFIMLCNNC
jgi:hypothetical protein